MNTTVVTQLPQNAHNAREFHTGADPTSGMPPLASNLSTTDWHAVGAFMEAVVPWPATSHDAGWVVMSNGYPDRRSTDGRRSDGKYPIGPGRAFKTRSDFTSFTKWAIPKTFYKDLYFCLSLQRDIATSHNGRAKGKRSAEAALALKAVWLDIDVGKEDGYQTLQEARGALARFVDKARLPAPSAIVKSGGGLHVYWISQTSMEPDHWRPCAEGLRALAESHELKCDLTLTTDPARLLRVPGTFNYKLVTPRPCELLPGPLKLYDFATDLAVLCSVTSTVVTGAVTGKLQSSSVPSGRSALSNFVVDGHESDFDTASLRRIQKLLGPPTDSLSNGLETEIEEIRSAVSAIPSSELGTENGWVRVARALAHEAAIYKSQSEQLWEILDAASILAPGYDAADNRNRWERYKNEAFDRAKPITIATIFDLAKKHGWAGYAPLAPSGVAAQGTSPISNLRSVSVGGLPLIPQKRQWLCGTYLMRGAISLLSAPGARGKTAWSIALAMSCASGKQILGAHLFGSAKTVLYISAEESTNEIHLRLHAAMQHHGISTKVLSSLHVIGAEKWGLHLVTVDRGTPRLDEKAWAELEKELDHFCPDILIADPLINFLGGADANNNSVAGLMMGRLARLAATRNMAVMIAHHVAKGRDPLAAESAMGAASFVNLARIALSIDPLQEDKACHLGRPARYSGLLEPNKTTAPRNPKTTGSDLFRSRCRMRNRRSTQTGTA